MKAIGGYFELEISDLNSIFHDDALALNSGRNSFEYILLNKNIRHILIPYFTCSAIIEPLIKLKISYSFYHIDIEFLPLLPKVDNSDVILYINYFGMCKSNIYKLISNTNILIIDNSQAFYEKPIFGLPTFYSPRKFFGVPDGGFVYNVKLNSTNFYCQDVSFNRISHLISRIENEPELGYSKFKENEEKIAGQSIKYMSKLTMKLLKGIEYENVKKKRLKNFYFLHEKLKNINRLKKFIDNANFSCPLIYPFWNDEGEVIRKRLINNKIYIAQYWPYVLTMVSEDKLEFDFAKNIVCIPIDQRLSLSDLKLIIEIINEK